jgi:hypothetical protein
MALDFHADNHYLPRMYLKPWETRSGRVWTYRVLVAHDSAPVWKTFSSKSVGHHLHLYTRQSAGKDSDQIERWFDREFERPAVEPLQKALSDKRLTPNEWKCLIRFLAAQDVRTPAWFSQRMKLWEETLPKLLKDGLEASIRRHDQARETGSSVPAPPHIENREQLPMRVRVERHASEGGEIGVEMLAGRKLWLWSIQRALTQTISILFKHQWTILRPPKNMTWVTSDNPVIRLNFNSTSEYNFDGGWNSPGTDIFLPLGPSHLLYTQVGSRPQQRGERMPKDQADLVRRFTAEHAWRTIFANEADSSVNSLRPRIVDPAEVQRERKQWQAWHEDQTSAEQEMNET